MPRVVPVQAMPPLAPEDPNDPGVSATFVLFAPNTTYPQHSHKEIEESYISISGAWSES